MLGFRIRPLVPPRSGNEARCCSPSSAECPGSQAAHLEQELPEPTSLAHQLAGWRPKAPGRSCARPMRERLGCDHTGVSWPQDTDSLRAVAFALFGALAGCMKRRQAFYKSQVRQSLGALLIHLEDPNPQVAKVRIGDTDFLSPTRSPQSSPRGTLPFLRPVLPVPFPLRRLHPGTSLSSGLPPRSRAGCTPDPTVHAGNLPAWLY